MRSSRLQPLGQQGRHPGSLTFTLSAETAGIEGMPAYQPGDQTRLLIGFTPPDQWQIALSGDRQLLTSGKSKSQQITVKIAGSEAMTELKSLGDAPQAEEAPGRLFMNQGGKLSEESDRRGVNARPLAANNVVAGDFDNDMDVDLFVLGSGDVGKQDNQLLLNRGEGHFDEVPGAGGAAGVRSGVGDSVTMVDVDGDGFLDLLVATGGSMGRGYGLPSDSGAYHLYRNVGNSNRWLEIDLEGAASNRDGIGAIVRVTTGGVTQVRVQDGGVHERGQNHSRLHFGLGKNASVEKIQIQWPSGRVQELSNVSVNQILRIQEPDHAKATVPEKQP